MLFDKFNTRSIFLTKILVNTLKLLNRVYNEICYKNLMQNSALEINFMCKELRKLIRELSIKMVKEIYEGACRRLGAACKRKV